MGEFGQLGGVRVGVVGVQVRFRQGFVVSAHHASGYSPALNGGLTCPDTANSQECAGAQVVFVLS
ncbi:hypothetical protein GCM10023159_31320 [Brevibacterium yomogidense]